MKKNKSSGELDFLRYPVKGRSAVGNLLAKMLPTFEKCLFNILGIRKESLVRLLLLSGSLIYQQIYTFFYNDLIIHLCLAMFFSYI